MFKNDAERKEGMSKFESELGNYEKKTYDIKKLKIKAGFNQTSNNEIKMPLKTPKDTAFTGESSRIEKPVRRT